MWQFGVPYPAKLWKTSNTSNNHWVSINSIGQGSKNKRRMSIWIDKWHKLLFIIQDCHRDPFWNIYWKSFSNESKVWLIFLSHETAIYQSALPKPPVMQFKTFLPLGQLTFVPRLWNGFTPWLEMISNSRHSPEGPSWTQIIKVSILAGERL